MPIECGVELKNGWGYIHCTTCDELSLVGNLNSQELTKEIEAFKKDHDHI